MIHLINYCKLLRYEEDPDYGYIKKQFEECRNAYNSLLYAEIFVINEKVTKPPKKKKIPLINILTPTIKAELPEFTRSVNFKQIACVKALSSFL